MFYWSPLHPVKWPDSLTDVIWMGRGKLEFDGTSVGVIGWSMLSGRLENDGGKGQKVTGGGGGSRKGGPRCGVSDSMGELPAWVLGCLVPVGGPASTLQMVRRCNVQLAPGRLNDERLQKSVCRTYSCFTPIGRSGVCSAESVKENRIGMNSPSGTSKAENWTTSS